MEAANRTHAFVFVSLTHVRPPRGVVPLLGCVRVAPPSPQPSEATLIDWAEMLGHEDPAQREVAVGSVAILISRSKGKPTHAAPRDKTGSTLRAMRPSEPPQLRLILAPVGSINATRTSARFASIQHCVAGMRICIVVLLLH